jgi:pilus assembly protein FimV
MEHLTMRIWPAVLSLLLLLVPVSASALGLGQIEANSALNEPLQARIDLRALQDGDLDGMQVRLGTSEQFKRAGIPRPFVLSKLKFETVPGGRDSSYIRVTTVKSVVEPFLNFLVEVTWPRGRIIREYTILLDPPVYGAAISSKAKEDLATVRITEEPQAAAPAPLPAPSSAPEPVAATPPPAPAVPSMPATRAQPSAPARAPEPMAAAPSPEPAVMPQQEPPPRATVPAPLPMAAIPGAYEVQRGDTLWSLATRYRPDSSISIQRMMLALLSANPDAFFLNNNINALRAGAILKIPDLSAYSPVDRATVLAEVNRHHALWDEYKANLAGRATVAPEGTMVAAAPTAPEPTTSTTSPTAGQPETTQPMVEPPSGQQPAVVEDPARLELVAAGQATEGAGTGSSADAEALRQQLNLAQEEADAKRRQADELDTRVQELESIVQDLQRAITLRDDNIAALQEMLSKAEQEAERLKEAAEQAAIQPDAGAIAPPGVPEPVIPEPVTPEPVAPEPVTPEAAAPEPVTPEPVMPEPVMPEPVTPEPVAPEPVTPEAAAPEPVTPEPAQPEPAAAEPPPEPRQPAPPAPPPPPAPSFLDSVLESLPVDPVLLGAGLGGLLVVLGGAALWRRRRGASDEEVEDLGELEAALMDESDLMYDEHGEPYLPDDVETEIAGPIGVEMPGDSPLEAEPEGDPEHSSTVITAPGTAETIAAAAAADAAAEPDEDPLTEVNVYLAYERYDQAEELVRSAIGQFPNRHEYKLRLLEVFYAAKDTASFEASARELQAAVGDSSPLLAEAQKMWQDMSPGRDLFSETESTVPEDQDVVFDVTDGRADTAKTIPVGMAGGADEASSVDFDLGFDGAAADQGEGSGSDSSVDFDLGFDEVGAGDAGGATEVGLDLDLASIGEGTGLDEPGDGGSSLDLDLGEVGGGADADADDSSLDFDLTELDSSVGATEEDAEATVPLPERAAAGDDDDLDFDLSGLGEGSLVDTQLPPGAPAGVIEESAAAGDDLDFDFDNLSGGSGGLDMGGASLDAGGASLDADVTALDLDLGATAGDGAGGAGSQLSGLDFDLSGDGGEAEPALGFDIGGEGGTEDLAGGASLDEGLDFGLNLEDAGGDDADLASGLDLDMSLPGADDALSGGEPASEETVKLDLGMGLGDDGAEDEFDTLKISGEDMPAIDDDLGIDLDLDSGLDAGEPTPTGIDTAFEDVFEEPLADAADDDPMELSMDGSDLIPKPTPPQEQEGGDFPEIDMDFDSQRSGEGGDDQYEATQYMLRDMPEGGSGAPGEDDQGRTLMLGEGLTGEVDEIQTKLDLAQAYIDMGDTDGAKGILDEVIAEGNPAQKQAAMGLLEKLASS